MLLRCDNPNCTKEATAAAKFLDPRRGHGDEHAYTRKHFCCQGCEIAIIDELERQAHYARLVH